MNCEICGEHLTTQWTDLHGEGVCVTCGAPYQVLQRDENNKLLDLPPKLKVKAEYVPALRRYWAETGRNMALGLYVVNHPRPDDIAAFNRWAETNIPAPPTTTPTA